MQDLIFHFSEDQLESLRQVAASHNRSLVEEFQELLTKFQKVLNDHLTPLSGDIEFKGESSNGKILHVKVPRALIEKEANPLVTAGMWLQAIVALRKHMGFGLLEAKLVVDILRGLTKNQV